MNGNVIAEKIEVFVVVRLNYAIELAMTQNDCVCRAPCRSTHVTITCNPLYDEQMLIETECLWACA